MRKRFEYLYNMKVLYCSLSWVFLFPFLFWVFHFGSKIQSRVYGYYIPLGILIKMCHVKWSKFYGDQHINWKDRIKSVESILCLTCYVHICGWIQSKPDYNKHVLFWVLKSCYLRICVHNIFDEKIYNFQVMYICCASVFIVNAVHFLLFTIIIVQRVSFRNIYFFEV